MLFANFNYFCQVFLLVSLLSHCYLFPIQKCVKLPLQQWIYCQHNPYHKIVKDHRLTLQWLTALSMLIQILMLNRLPQVLKCQLRFYRLHQVDQTCLLKHCRLHPVCHLDSHCASDQEVYLLRYVMLLFSLKHLFNWLCCMGTLTLFHRQWMRNNILFSVINYFNYLLIYFA